MSFPAMSSSIALGTLVGWMLVLTVKHVIGDFLLQNAWIATKDRKTGWALPLLVHCLIHGGLTMLLVAVVQPKLWYVGLIDFAVHITIDRIKGLLVSNYDIAVGQRWFWWLIGIDQALHHLTGFFLAIFITGNA